MTLLRNERDYLFYFIALKVISYLQKDSNESEFDFGSSSSGDDIKETQQFVLEIDSGERQEDEELRYAVAYNRSRPCIIIPPVRSQILEHQYQQVRNSGMIQMMKKVVTWLLLMLLPTIL